MTSLLHPLPAPVIGAAPASSRTRTLPHRWPVLLAGGGAGLLLAFLLLLAAPDVRDAALRLVPAEPSAPLPAGADPARDLAPNVQRLEARFAAHTPPGAYLIVSTTENRFRLMNQDQLTREGLCSTGSYVQLQGADGREWLFESPRGAHRVQRKITNPVWTKPDWAFVEAGRPVPPLGSPERLERGVLGDYALALGDGYLLHGTLYQRLLGQPVTHGCVRLGDDDLAAIYHALRVGSPVYLY